MFKRVCFLLTIALAVVPSCKKEHGNTCQGPTLISPVNNSSTGIRPTFSWTNCNANQGGTVYIMELSNNLQNYVLVDSQQTTTNHLTLDSTLTYGNTYMWWVRTGSLTSQMDTFSVYPDSLVSGTYQVTVVYQQIIASSTGLPQASDSTLGHCKITIQALGQGTVLLIDDSVALMQFSESYDPSVNYSNGIISYGSPYGSYIQFTGNSISAFYGSSSLAGQTGNFWNGSKVP